MASLPPSRRRASPTQRSPSPKASSQAFNRTESRASTVSEDSQTILLNPSSRSDKQDSETQEENQTPRQSTSQEVDEPRRCWICYSDEPDDPPDVSPWRDPCPCALVAHEACLLDWVADLDAPGSKRQRKPGEKILCPQCKSEIKVEKPRSYIVDAVRALEIKTSQAVLPSVALLSAYSLWYLCWLHGTTSVMVVFGTEDSERILAPLMTSLPKPSENFQGFIDNLKQRWRLDLGLGLIPPMLIISRTTLADGILPIIPMLFYATKPDLDTNADFGTWPPSAGLSFAVVPFLRAMYNQYYERVWGHHVKRWMKEIQPRAGSDAQGGVNVNRQDVAVPIEGENVIDIDIEVELEDWDEGDQAPGVLDAPPTPEVAHALNDPPLDAPVDAPAGEQDAAPAPDVPRARQQNGNAAPAAPLADADPQPPIERFNVAVSTNKLAASVLGALAFPAVSAVMGEVLRIALPKSWTACVSGKGGRPSGLLQQKWGRSLVGGAMAVVLKDAVLLYVRWRMAQDHRMRRIVDYKGKGKKVSR